ncbi:hypothetical protein [uncultured Roseobacter sp.]|uniref:hypothetical protein n=1 Tax=uncultured Roseobacter sp. TaxID=114847 RepID=UPI0026080B71|nr:hypothetical protein [uncultured Roseobacter sp.]
MTSENTEEYQLLSRAAGFLEAARIVADDSGGKPSLVAPIAHLVAHGLEVLLKHWLLRSGTSAKDLQHDYGHDLSKLWAAPKSEPFRKAAEQEATRALYEAKTSGRFLDEEWPEPTSFLEEHINRFSYLHSHSSGYALRYAARENEEVPVPLFFLDVFEPLKDRLCRSYSRQDFDI